MSETIEIRRREGDTLLFAFEVGQVASPSRALGLALEAAVAAGVDLGRAALRDVEAGGANLRGAKLAEAELTGAVLDGADLSGADLTGAVMLRISALGAVFDGASLEGAHIWAAELDDASLKSVRAERANFDDAKLRRAILTGGDFSEGSMLRANLSRVDAQRANFTGLRAIDADFSLANLSRAVLDQADLRATCIDQVRFDGASLIGTQLGDWDSAARRWADDEAEEILAAFPPAEPAVRFGWRRRWLFGAVPGSAAMALFCAWMATQIGGGGLGEDLSSSGRLILSLMFGAFGLILGAAALTYGVALFDREPVVTIDQRGVLDRRLSPKPIAWDDLQSLVPMLHGGQSMLVLNVLRSKTYPLARNPLWAVNRLSSRLLGRPELTLRMTGLDADFNSVLNALQSAAATRPAAA